MQRKISVLTEMLQNTIFFRGMNPVTSANITLPAAR